LTPAILAILATIAVGLPLVASLFPAASRITLLALSYLYGSGAIFLTLFGLSAAGIRWSLPIVAASLLLLTGVAISGVVRRSALAHAPMVSRSVEGKVWHAIPFDLLTLTMLTGFGLFATLAPLSEWDFWAIWGLKARVFFEAGGIDWRFLESPLYGFSHSDYPLLLPLNFDFVALLNSGWNDRWLGFMFLAFAASFLLLARELLLDDLPYGYAALGTFIMASAACSQFVGLAETPLVVLSAAGVLLMRRGLRDGDRHSFRNGAVLLGLAGCCKNEGLAMIASVAIALAVVERRQLRRFAQFWPALVIPLPWLVMRAIHDLPTDLAGGPVVQRALARLPTLHLLLLTLVNRIAYREFWISLLAAWVVVAFGQTILRKSKSEDSFVGRVDLFVIVAMAIQMAFYIASYAVTPNDLGWHIATSWSRVSEQVAAPLTYVTVVMLGRMMHRGATNHPSLH
jgi:hypothetical protein